MCFDECYFYENGFNIENIFKVLNMKKSAPYESFCCYYSLNKLICSLTMRLQETMKQNFRSTKLPIDTNLKH